MILQTLGWVATRRVFAISWTLINTPESVNTVSLELRFLMSPCNIAPSAGQKCKNRFLEKEEP
jgi:hypothetical protein